MKKIKKILRLKHEAGLSNRTIAGACKISNITVGEYWRRAEAAGVGWPLGIAACRLGFPVRYLRTSRYLHSLAQTRQDGSYLNFLRTLNKTDVLILDDWMRDPVPLSAAQDLLEVFDDRFGKTATLMVSQVPVADWHARFPDPTLGAPLPTDLSAPQAGPNQPLLKIGDLCSECGQAAVVNEEGCRKCYACGYSEC